MVLQHGCDKGVIHRAILGVVGADVGFECSSVPVVLDMPNLVLKEIDLRGTIGYANDHEETIKLVQEGKIDLAPFITAKIALDELVSEGFDQLINNNEQHVKILVNPNA